jgi:type I restriction enzyme S subunit
MYPTKKLSEICEKITDWTHQTPTYFDSGYIFLSSKNVTSGKIDWDNIKYIDEKQHQEMYKRVAPRKWDILLAKNGTTWVAAIVDKDEVFDIYVSLALLRPKSEVQSEYLLYFINSSLAKKQFNSRLKWVGVPNLHLWEIKEVEIPLPPLSTQSRIVAHLDSAFASIDEQISLLRANIADVENMRKSVLEKSFQSGEYELKKLWDIFDVRDGTHDSPKFHTTGYPLITSKNLWENGIDFWNIKLISQEDYDKINQRSKVNKWDLLFAMIGTIGTPTIVDIETEFAIKNVALFKPKNTEADMQYLRYFLLSDFVIQKMLSESKWATQKFVGLGYLRAFQIPLPPLPRQHEIVAHLDEVFETTRALRMEYEAQIRDLETLKQSLLEEAFAGRLVPEEDEA